MEAVAVAAVEEGAEAAAGVASSAAAARLCNEMSDCSIIVVASTALFSRRHLGRRPLGRRLREHRLQQLHRC